MNRSALRAAVPPLVALVVLLTLCEGTVRLLEVPRWLVPPPSAIGAAGAQEASSLLGAAVTTGRSALVGFGLSAVLGVLVAVLLASSRLVERALYPYTLFLQTVPIVAIAPLLVLWFGLGLFPKVLICALIVFFPILINTAVGLRTIDRTLLEAAHSLGAGRRQMLWYVEAPLSLRTVLGGVKMGLTLAVTGAVVAEFVASDAGLGNLMLRARFNYDAEQDHAHERGRDLRPDASGGAASPPLLRPPTEHRVLPWCMATGSAGPSAVRRHHTRHIPPRHAAVAAAFPKRHRAQRRRRHDPGGRSRTERRRAGPPLCRPRHGRPAP